MTTHFKLIIGNKNYSSWSLRPWILMKYFKIPFDEVIIPLYEGSYKKKILRYSPTGKVPALIHGKVHVWESLAIGEYIADLYPKKKLWPQDKATRAWARSIAQEMHAGFTQLRTHMPMNLKASYPGKGMNPEVAADIARLTEIWTQCRRRFKNKGPFLFGHFTVADAMFLPVVTRLKTYGVKLGKLAGEYMTTMLDMPAFREWEAAAIKEKWVLKKSEIYNLKLSGKPSGKA